MSAWIDVTAASNWQPGISLLGGGPLTITDGALTALDVTDSTSADGLYYQFSSGIWTPTHTIGTPPTDGMLPFIKYIGPVYDNLIDIRLTMRNRAAIDDAGFDGFYFYGPLGSIPEGSYPDAQTFGFQYTVDGLPPAGGYSDVDTGDLYTILNHIFGVVANVDFDHVTFALPPQVYFDIIKVELLADPPPGFWTDFVNCQEVF